MDLGLGEQQEILKTSARKFLETECPLSLVRQLEGSEEGYSPELWQKMADLGWLGLAIPSSYGGEGGALVDQGALFEELGRALVPGPVLASSSLAAQVILQNGTETQKERLLPGLAGGATIVTTALTPPGFGHEDEVAIRAIIDGRGYTLEGTAIFVPYAHVADMALCVVGLQGSTVETEFLTVFLVNLRASGVEVTLLESVAGYRQHQVRFSGTRVGSDDVLGQVGAAPHVLAIAQDWATVAQCAEMVGRAEKILEMVVEYSKTRVQFGRPIGSFQAIQHQCADLRTAVDGARLAAYQAAWKLDQGFPCAEDVAVAKTCAGNLSRQAVAVGHGVFAGIAFTTEHDMQLYTLRSKIAEANLGDADFHLDRLADLMNR